MATATALGATTTSQHLPPLKRFKSKIKKHADVKSKQKGKRRGRGGYVPPAAMVSLSDLAYGSADSTSTLDNSLSDLEATVQALAIGGAGQSHLEEHADEETGEKYWYNTLTGKTGWTKAEALM